MGYPIGKPNIDQGGVLKGATPADWQRYLGASFMNSGIIPGQLDGTVTGTVGWAYKVSPLAAFMWTGGDKKGMIVPSEGGTISVSAPASGSSRTDCIYLDGMGVLRVAEGRTSPPEGLTLDVRTIPAGAQSTQSSTSSWSKQYAIPAGASLGRLAHWRDPGGGAASMASVTRYTKRITVPSDRIVRVDVTTTLKAADKLKPGHMGLTVKIDGSSTWGQSLSCAYDEAWRTYGSTWSAVLREGAHTVTVTTHGNSGGTWQFAESGLSDTEVSVWDGGVSA